MKYNLKFLIPLFVSMILLTGCREWIEFDIQRYLFGFFFTLVIGVIGLIIMAFKGGNKNDRK